MLWWTIRKLQSKDELERYEAAKKLGESRNPRAIKPLITALQDDDWDVSSRANQALVKIGKPAVESLIELLKHGGYSLRKTAEMLGKIGDNQAMDALISVLRSNIDDYDSPHTATAKALMKIDPNWVHSESARNAIPGLINDLSAYDRDDRADAESLLRRIDPNWRKSETVKNLIPDLIRDAMRFNNDSEEILGKIDPNWRKSEVAIKTLPDLIIYLNQVSYDPQFLEYAAKTLVEIVGGTRAIEPLLHILQDNNATTDVIEELLRSILDKSAEKLDIDILSRITKLTSTTMFYHAECGKDSHEYTADFSMLKQLARQELIRRGLKD